MERFTSQPGTVHHHGRSLRIGPFRGQRVRYIATDLQVTESDVIIGFISAYSTTRIAAGPALMWSEELPALVETVSEALDAVLEVRP